MRASNEADFDDRKVRSILSVSCESGISITAASVLE